jgi:hypothetical protein
MSSLPTKACVLTLLALTLTAAEGRSGPLPREILGGELIVKEALDTLDAPGGRIRYLADEELGRAFPGYLFYAVVYAPTAASHLPAPLKAATVAAVDPDGHVLWLAGQAEYLQLFRAGFYPSRKLERDPLAIRAALVLVRAAHPDYKLRVVEDDIQITTDPRGVRHATGKLVLAEGGAGDIVVNLNLDPCSDPTRFVVKVNLTALRVDPKVTTAEITAAEKLVKSYAETNRLAVAEVKYVEDPVLRRSAPGYLFFLVPAAGDPEREDPAREKTRYSVVVVGPDSKVVNLFGAGAHLGAWLNATVGLVQDEAGIKTAGTLIQRLVVAQHPGYQFGDPGTPDIQNLEGGLRRVVVRTPVTGPRGGRWVFTYSFTIGRRGRIVAWGMGLVPAK